MSLQMTLCETYAINMESMGVWGRVTQNIFTEDALRLHLCHF